VYPHLSHNLAVLQCCYNFDSVPSTTYAQNSQQMKEPNFLQQKILEYPRVTGILALLIGAYGAYISIYEPYTKVLAQEPEIYFSRTGIFLSICLPLIGLLYVIFGRRCAEIMLSDPADQKPIVKVISIGSFAAIAGVLFYVITNFIEAKGYHFQ
jgi:hypothetical protein